MSEHHSMRKIREVLRLKHVLELAERPIAAAVGIGHGTVNEYIKRAKRAGLTWKEAEPLSDAEVEARLFVQVGRNEPAARAAVDFAWVHMELRRAGVTLELLWGEYQQALVDGGGGQKPYQYSRFCELYRTYAKKLSPVMRQVHRAGESAFIDFSGSKPRIFDPVTGEATEVELFVMTLGASNYTYAEATRTQALEDFVGATVHGLEYFGGVPEMLVPDQLKSAVKTPDRIEPEVNATYAELAQHYTTAVVPARPRKPRDKAKVEGAVLIAQRWILACLRNRRFFSLEELNAAIRELLERLNTRPFQKLEGCRRTAFEKLDRPALRPLPARRYEIGAWKLGVGVNIDYHLEYDHRVYSVPCALIRAKVDVRATATVVEVWHDRERVASHERSYGPKGTAVTNPEHRPRAHREWGEWPPERLVGWAAQTGPKTAEVVAAMLGHRTHPATGRRACMGLVRMVERHGAARVEAACGRAVAIGNPKYKSVKAILESGLDKVPLTEEPEPKRVVHDNIRGGAYFDRGESGSVGEKGEERAKIEAGYLEKERFAIMNEPRDDAGRAGRRSGPVEGSQEVSNGVSLGAVIAAPSRARTEPLPALIGRLQAMWTRTPAPPQGGRQPVSERGGDDYRHEQSGDSPCEGQSMCVGQASGGGERAREEMRCESDDVCLNHHDLERRDRGEM
jgi:transposase